MHELEDFVPTSVDAGETRIFVRHRGTGAPILLLHGFPQTHLIARHFAVVCADLRGAGVAYLDQRYTILQR